MSTPDPIVTGIADATAPYAAHLALSDMSGVVVRGTGGGSVSAVEIALVAQEHPCVPRAKVLAVYPADKIPGRLRVAPGEMLIEAMTHSL